MDLAADEVRIGEEGLPAGQAGNLVRLTKEAWNTLVEKITAGELKTI